MLRASIAPLLLLGTGLLRIAHSLREASHLLEGITADNVMIHRANMTKQGCIPDCGMNPRCDNECQLSACKDCTICKNCAGNSPDLQCNGGGIDCQKEFDDAPPGGNAKRQVCQSSFHYDACGGCQFCCDRSACDSEERGFPTYGSAACNFASCSRCFPECPVQFTTTTTAGPTTTTEDPCPLNCRNAAEPPPGSQVPPLPWEQLCREFAEQCSDCPACSAETTTTLRQTTVTVSLSNCDYYCTMPDEPNRDNNFEAWEAWDKKQQKVCGWSKETCQNCEACKRRLAQEEDHAGPSFGSAGTALLLAASLALGLHF